MPLITKSLADKAKGKSKEYYIWDDQLKGFGLAVYPSGNKSYIVRYWLDRKSWQMALGDIKVLTAKQARDAARQYLAEVKLGKNPKLEREKKQTDPYFEDLCERFDQEHIAIRLKPSTQKQWRRYIEKDILPYFKRMKVREIRQQDISNFHSKFHSTPTKANHLLEILKVMFKKAEVWDMRPLNSNPCTHIEKFPSNSIERPLTEEEFVRLSDYLHEAERIEEERPSVINAIRLLIMTGCRKNEIAQLKWEYIDWEKSCIDFPDTKTGRKTLKVSKQVIEYLKEISEDPKTPFKSNPYVIYSPLKPGTYYQDLQGAWERIRKRVGIEDVRIHDLRHTYGTFALNEFDNLKLVQKLMKHASLQSTQRYAHVLESRMDKAVDQMGTLMGQIGRKPKANDNLPANDNAAMSG